MLHGNTARCARFAVGKGAPTGLIAIAVATALAVMHVPGLFTGCLLIIRSVSLLGEVAIVQCWERGRCPTADSPLLPVPERAR